MSPRPALLLFAFSSPFYLVLQNLMNSYFFSYLTFTTINVSLVHALLPTLYSFSYPVLSHLILAAAITSRIGYVLLSSMDEVCDIVSEYDGQCDGHGENGDEWCRGSGGIRPNAW